MQYLMLTARITLLVVFAVSTAGKARGPRYYAAFVDSLKPFLPGFAARHVAAALVTATEAACVVLLALPSTAAAGLGVSAALLGVFSGAIAWAKLAGKDATCRCFGSRATPLGLVHVARNLVLILFALGGLAAFGAAESNPYAAVAATVTGLTAATILISLDSLATLLRPPP